MAENISLALRREVRRRAGSRCEYWSHSTGLQRRVGSFIVVCMSTVELILKKASALPDELQKEALHYVDYLLARLAEGHEAREWSRFSGEQLTAQYSEGDAIYDQD
jgi:hypothetical protein